MVEKKDVLRSLSNLQFFSREYGVFLADATVDGNTSPPEMNGYLRLPIHNTLHDIAEWRVTNIKIKADRLLKELIKELSIVKKRYDAGQISDVTMSLIIAGVYSPPYSIHDFRSKIKRAIKQLPKYCSSCKKIFKEKVCPRCNMRGENSRIRKYIEYRLISAEEYEKRKK